MDTPIKALCEGSDEKGFAVVAGISESRDRATVIISNYGERPVECLLRLKGLEWMRISYVVKVIDGRHSLDTVDNGTLEAGGKGQELFLNMPPYSVYVVALSEV